MKHACTLISMLFISLYSSKPFRGAILISNSAKPYELGLKLDNAAAGSVSSSTSNLFISKTILKREITSASSSTSRILFELLVLFVVLEEGDEGINDIFHLHFL